MSKALNNNYSFSEDWLRSFYQCTTAAKASIALIDTDLKVIAANKRAQEIHQFLFSKPLPVKFDIGTFFKIEELKEIIEISKMALEGESKELEFQGVIAGARYNFVIDTRPVEIDDSIVGLIMTARDIRKQVLKDRQKILQGATLKAILDATPDGIYALDRDYKLIAINKQGIEDFKKNGYKVKEGTNLHDIIEPEKLERWKEEYFSRAFNGESFFYEGPMNLEKDLKIYVNNKYRPVYDQDNQIIAVAELSRDITQSVMQAQTIKEQVEILDQKNIELKKYIDSNLQLESFAYIASHDLKAPLRSVVSFAHLLKNRAGAELDEKSKGYLDIVIKSSENMQLLINDLLTYSRVKTQKIKIKELNLQSLLSRILIELRSEIDENQAEIVLPENMPNILADESLMIQLFSNLIRNGMKFVEKGKKPKVEIKMEEFALEWKFYVSDEGIGIDPKNHEKIFGTFNKLHSNDLFEGTGLGLTICKGIVEKHGGLISVKSSLGKGSTFIFSISKNLKNQIIPSE